MKYQFRPTGVCCQMMLLDVDANGVIMSAEALGGCNGNLKGVCSLIKGMKAADAAEKMRGICCGSKGTSCPDQMSKALDEIVREQNAQ